MKSAIAIISLICIGSCSVLTGCASIVSGRHADVAFDSYPANAHVVIHDNDGRAVASLNTPGVVSLKRNRRWFLPARYTATIEAPGHAPAQVPIRSTVNPWILGNVVIGGIPGLIVDNATGAAWQPRHSEIHRQLEPLGASMYSSNQPPPLAPNAGPPLVAERPPMPASGQINQHTPPADPRSPQQGATY